MAKPTKAEPAAPPPAPEGPVMVTMLTAVQDDRRTLGKGRETQEPREVAARWMVMGWAEPAPGVTFTRAELVTAGRWALEYHDQARGNRGTPPEKYWAIPAHARFLARLEALTRPALGPEGDTAA